MIRAWLILAVAACGGATEESDGTSPPASTDTPPTTPVTPSTGTPPNTTWSPPCEPSLPDAAVNDDGACVFDTPLEVACAGMDAWGVIWDHCPTSAEAHAADEAWATPPATAGWTVRGCGCGFGVCEAYGWSDASGSWSAEFDVYTGALTAISWSAPEGIGCCVDRFAWVGWIGESC